jgi:hypothetical protein
MPVAGLRGTGDWGTDERPKNFRDNVLRYNPNGTAPILALSSKAKKRTVDDPEFFWWAEGNAMVRLQVNGALGAADTLVTVDTADPTTTTMGANYGKAGHLKNGDILLVEPSADNATFNHELLEVDSVLSDTQFTVRRAAGGTSAASIADDRWLTLIGSAYAEGTAAPRPTSRNPLKFNNYTQIFKDTYELTGTADKTRTRTGNNWSEDKKRKMWDHAQKIEWSILFGRKAETVGDNGKPKRFMGGLREFIPATNTTVFGSAVTTTSLLAALAPLFDFDTGAGDTRIAFAGSEAMVQLGLVIEAKTNIQISKSEAPVKVYGINFQEFITPMGKILFKIHPLMSRHGLYKKSIFVVDFDAFHYVAMRDRDTKAKDDVQAEDEDVRRGFVQTECSCEVDYGGLTMAYLGNVSAT